MDGVGEPAVAAFLGEAEQILGVGGTVGLKLFSGDLGTCCGHIGYLCHYCVLYKFHADLFPSIEQDGIGMMEPPVLA